MKIQTSYLSAAINQRKKSLDWNRTINLIAYAASNRIILYDPQEGCVIGASDQGHGTSISCVQWIKNHDQSNSRVSFLLSTSSDGSAKLWTYHNTKIYPPTSSCLNITNSLKIFATLQGHQGNVSCSYAVTFSSQNNEITDKIFVVTTADDFLLKGWAVNIDSGGEDEIFTYKLPGRSLALDLLVLPANSFGSSHWPLVIYGGDDGRLHLMTSTDGRTYLPSCALSGHQDWITSLSYCRNDGDILLSSGSKDGLIRLWRMSSEARRRNLQSELLETKSTQVDLPSASPEFDDNGVIALSCSLESVLHGHDGLVSNLDWKGGRGRLLSCSTTEDRSVVIWEQEQEQEEDASDGGREGIWVEKVRLGEIGGNREGFFNARFGPLGDAVAATSYQGGLHLWCCIDGSWIPQPVVSGHFDQVVDLDWEKKGRYLLTVSKDQTTRLHSQWVQNLQKTVWQEIARPQVHGYDMTCVACLDRFRFASAGEEKVIRGFTATKTFVKRSRKISAFYSETDSDALDLPETASLSSLGLSNKGEEQSTNKEGKESVDKGPPTEDELMMGTLWPEVSKLYGHGHELLSLASSRDGDLLASSCRAAAPIDTNIILWNTKKWVEEASLLHHRLSVIQMEFSSCDQFLLSVSRDRSWAVFQRDADGVFSLKSHSGVLDKKSQHNRIIWSCGWVPGSLSFITGSRDKSVVLWHPVLDSEKHVASWKRGKVFKESEEVVAVAVSRLGLKELDNEKCLIAVGLVTGRLILRVFDEVKNEVLETLEVEVSHWKSIRRLKFRPHHHSSDLLTLASCGDDHSVLLHEIAV